MFYMQACCCPCIPHFAQRGEDAAERRDWRPAFNSHGNYIVGHGKSSKKHGIVFLNFCGNPA